MPTCDLSREREELVSSPKGCHQTKMNLQIKYREDYRIQTIQICRINSMVQSILLAKTESPPKDINTSNESFEFGLLLFPRVM